MNRFMTVSFLLAATLTSQEFRATISGRVTDAQNAVIAGVKIVVTQIGTEAKFETASAADGLYTLPFLQPGTYRLTAEAQGFKRHLRDTLAVSANQRIGVDIQMELGAVTDTINVTGEAPIVAAPLLWEEVKEGLKMEDFSDETILKRLKQIGDPFEGLFRKKVNADFLLKVIEERYLFLFDK